MMQWLRTVGAIVTMLSLQGCFVVTNRQIAELEGHIDKAKLEMQRLEYVRKRAVDFHDESTAVQRAIADAAALKGVDPAIRVPLVHFDAAGIAELRQPPRSMVYVPSSRPSVTELEEWLYELNRDIQRGINLGRKLPTAERDLQALKARLAAIEASPAAIEASPASTARSTAPRAGGR